METQTKGKRHERADCDGAEDSLSDDGRRKQQRVAVNASMHDAALLSDETIAQYHTRGFVVIPSFLSPEELLFLQQESTQLFHALHNDDATAAKLIVDQGCVLDMMAECPMAEDAPARVDPLAYLSARARQVRRLCGAESSTSSSNILQELLFEKISRHAAILLQTQEVFFFNEHYVVKPPHSSVEFRWHRDDDEQLAMCVHRTQIAPYVSAWCALDDVTLANGPLRFVPLHAVKDADSDPDCEQLELLATEPLCVQAGTIVLFLSHVWHCSSSNDSSDTRRAFYAQFSRERITATPKDTAPLSFAIPCTK